MNQHKVKLLLLFLFLINLPLHAALDSTNYRIVKPLDQEWLVYNKKYSSYVYYVSTINKNTHIVNQWLPYEKYNNYILSFEAEPQLSFFINNRLIYQNNQNVIKQVYIPIKDLKKYNEGGNYLMTFYNPNHKLPLSSTFIIYKSEHQPEQKFNTSLLIKKRRVNENLSPYLLSVLFILALVAVLKHKFTRRFEEFLGFKNTLANTWLEDISTINVLSISLFLIILINSIILALITNFTEKTFQFLNLFSLRVPWSTSGQIILTTIVFVILFFAKYLFLLFVGWIFNVYNIIKIQFLEFVKGFLRFNAIFITILFLIISYNETVQLPILGFGVYALVLVLILVTLRTAFLIIKVGNYRNIYLFSYLCTTELIPLTIIIKIILFRNN